MCRSFGIGAAFGVMPFVWTPLERDCVGSSTTFGVAAMFWRAAERVGGGGGPCPFMATGGSYDSMINDVRAEIGARTAVGLGEEA